MGYVGAAPYAHKIPIGEHLGIATRTGRHCAVRSRPRWSGWTESAPSRQCRHALITASVEKELRACPRGGEIVSCRRRAGCRVRRPVHAVELFKRWTNRRSVPAVAQSTERVDLRARRGRGVTATRLTEGRRCGPRIVARIVGAGCPDTDASRCDCPAERDVLPAERRRRVPNSRRGRVRRRDGLPRRRALGRGARSTIRARVSARAAVRVVCLKVNACRAADRHAAGSIGTRSGIALDTHVRQCVPWRVGRTIHARRIRIRRRAVRRVSRAGFQRPDVGARVATGIEWFVGRVFDTQNRAAALHGRGGGQKRDCGDRKAQPARHHHVPLIVNPPLPDEINGAASTAVVVPFDLDRDVSTRTKPPPISAPPATKAIVDIVAALRASLRSPCPVGSHPLESQ